MDNKLRNLLLNNYEKSLPSKRDTEEFISNFHQYRAKKKAQEKTHYALIFACLLILSMIGYFMSASNKLEYGLSGALIGILLSIILWITWGSRNSY